MRAEHIEEILGDTLADHTGPEQLAALVTALALAAEQNEYVYTKFLGMSQMNNVLADGLLAMPCECDDPEWAGPSKCRRCSTLANALVVAEEFDLEDVEGE